jgi:hypothetical protein
MSQENFNNKFVERKLYLHFNSNIKKILNEILNFVTFDAEPDVDSPIN